MIVYVLTAISCVNAMDAMNAHSAVADRNGLSFVMLDDPSSGVVTSEVVTNEPSSFSCFKASLYSRRLSRLDKRQMRGGLEMADFLGDRLGDEGGVSGMSTTGELSVVYMSVRGMMLSKMRDVVLSRDVAVFGRKERRYERRVLKYKTVSKKDLVDDSSRR